ncbi:MAG: glycyl-radical enzyme activating protein [Desulfatirhabdiaceae bacterium]|jgi:pyruvate formate lyase activating enzyme
MKNQALITNIQRFSINDGPGIRTTVFLKGCPLNCEWCHNPECKDQEALIFWKKYTCVQCGRCYGACPRGAINPPVSPEIARENSSYHKIIREKCDRCMKCVKACIYEALTADSRLMTVDQVIKEVESDMPFYRNSGGGLTVSGGEPVAHPEFVIELLKAAKERGIHVCLDTTGYCPWEVLKRFMEYVDIFLYDLKHLDPEKHKEKTGVDNKLILENLKKLSEANKQIRIRIPVIPGYNDSLEYMEEVVVFLESLPNRVQGVDMMPFHNWCQDKYGWLGIDWSMADTESMDPIEVEPLKEIFSSAGFECTVGG